ncbi:MAG: CoA transferase [Geminicoccaceae bacterium]|nr:MAG: CoA transferase [Geminicoccaceae bacterium]
MTGFGALRGLKVVDLTRVLGGPYGTQILADHGAEVIKIEPPQGDEVRDWGPPFDADGTASYFLGVNRNKRSLGLDLAKAEGREVLLRLLAEADVLIENFKPGSMEKWGLGYEEVLQRRFPRLIHARISGFGADGPYGGLPGYDAIIQAMAGHFSVNGDERSGPTRMGIPLVDIGTGLYTALGILMAVIERARSGAGQFLDMTLYDCGVALMFPHIPNYVLSGKLPGLTGNAHPNICPYDKFETQGGPIFIAVGNNRAFARFTEAIGTPELAADPRFASNGDRLRHKAELTALLEARLRDVDGPALCTELLAKGVPAGPVQNTQDVWDNPHTHHRHMAVEQAGYRNFGTPIKFSRTPGAVQAVPPRFGENGRAILREAGFDDAEIEAMIEADVVLERRRT